tara:strand:- start:7 stop:390 length:384 start_codon:yes stop_codon:yes gene_type:complete
MKLNNFISFKKLAKLILILFSLIFLLITPEVVNSAEILQINSYDSIVIGDQNRNITLTLFCINIDSSNQFAAQELLKKNFPRGTKVKIKPFGKDEDKLLAKVYKFNSNVEMTELLNAENLSKNTCEN